MARPTPPPIARDLARDSARDTGAPKVQDAAALGVAPHGAVLA